MAQLSEYHLIDAGWACYPGFAKINDFGVKVLEDGVAPSIQISMDERRRTSVPRREQAPMATSTQHQ